MGFGLHKCVGQHLARMEARSYFNYLLKYFPEFEIVESRWLVSWWARGYAALTIRA
jgi:cytochrome P450